VSKQAWSPGEREVSRKNHCAGNAGSFRCDRRDMLVAFYFACEAAGASSARHSLRPLFPWANGSCTTRTHRRRENRGRRILQLDAVIARSQRVPPRRARMINSATEAIHSHSAATWIASRSPSSGARSRDPLLAMTASNWLFET